MKRTMATLAAGVGMLALAGTASASTLFSGTYGNAYFKPDIPGLIELEVKPNNNKAVTEFCGSIGSNAACSDTPVAGEARFVTDGKVQTSSGSGEIKPDSDILGEVTFFVNEGTFGDLMFSIQLEDLEDLSFKATANYEGNISDVFDMSSVGGSAQSNDKFLILANPGVRIVSVLLEASGRDGESTIGAFKSLKQFYVSEVPLPPAALLFGTALAGVGFMSRRKKAANAA